MKRFYMKAIRFLSVISAIVLVVFSLTACQPEKNNQAEPTAQIETTTAAEENDLYNMDHYESNEVFDFVKVNQGGKYDELCTTYQFNYLSDGLKIEGYLSIPISIEKTQAPGKCVIFDKALVFEPGSDYQYSNSNYLLLAEIVEQVSGVPYHDYLRKSFFEPLEMTHTGFTDEISGNPAWSFALSATESTEEGFYTPGITKCAGDVVSNAEDMEKWMRGLSGGKVISHDAYTQMSQEVNPDSYEEYCYGLWKMPYGGVGHVGQIPPHFGAVDYINTERDVCLFAVTNSGRGMSYVQEIPQVLLSILFEE